MTRRNSGTWEPGERREYSDASTVEPTTGLPLIASGSKAKLVVRRRQQEVQPPLPGTNVRDVPWGTEGVQRYSPHCLSFIV